MPLSPLAGKPAPKEVLIDVARLERDYYDRKPDVSKNTQLVSFGTSRITAPAFLVGSPGFPIFPTFHWRPICSATSAGARCPMSGNVTMAILGKKE